MANTFKITAAASDRLAKKSVVTFNDGVTTIQVITAEPDPSVDAMAGAKALLQRALTETQ